MAKKQSPEAESPSSKPGAGGGGGSVPPAPKKSSKKNWAGLFVLVFIIAVLIVLALSGV